MRIGTYALHFGTAVLAFGLGSVAITPVLAASAETAANSDIVADEDADGGARLNLSDVIREVLGHNPELKAAQFETSVKQAEIGPRGSYEDPMLSVATMNDPAGGKEVALTQKIPFPGKLTKLRNAARSSYNAQKEVFRGKQLQLIREAKTIYYELYLAFKKKDILREQKNVLSQLIVVTRKNYSLGRVSQAELLNMQVEETMLIDQMLMADKLVKVKLAELNRVMGRNESAALGRPEELQKTKFDFVKFNEKTIGEQILGHNPELKAAGLQAEQADTKLSYAKWNYLPDFEFKVGYGANAATGMVGMTLPLWAFSKQSQEVKGAAAEKSKTDAMLDEQRNRLVQMIHSAYAALEEAARRVELYETGLLPLARQSVTVGRPAYLTGKLDYAVLLNSVNRRYQTEYAYSEALVAYETKIADFETLLGAPLGEL